MMAVSGFFLSMTKLVLCKISLLCTIPMPDPPLKKQKCSIIKVSGHGKSFIHQHDHEIESSDSESSDSSSDVDIVELRNRLGPEADANAIIAMDQDKPKTLNLNDYNIMFHIPRLLPKPGMTLADNADYSSLLGRVKTMATKMDMPMINITITQKESEVDKENILVSESDGGDEEKRKLRRKRR